MNSIFERKCKGEVIQGWKDIDAPNPSLGDEREDGDGVRWRCFQRGNPHCEAMWEKM